MDQNSLVEFADSARQHADHLRADIANAATRSEHMRLVALWAEADVLASVARTILDHHYGEPQE